MEEQYRAVNATCKLGSSKRISATTYMEMLWLYKREDMLPTPLGLRYDLRSRLIQGYVKAEFKYLQKLYIFFNLNNVEYETLEEWLVFCNSVDLREVHSGDKAPKVGHWHKVLLQKISQIEALEAQVEELQYKYSKALEINKRLEVDITSYKHTIETLQRQTGVSQQTNE